MVVVQVLMMMGVTTSLPLLPLFLEAELGLDRGREVEIWSGIISAAHFLTMTISSPIWGALADRYGRKLMVLRTTAAVGLFNLLIVLVGDQYQLLAVRLAMGVFSGFAASATALVGSVTPKERLGYALGLLSTGQLLGIVFGPLLGGVLSSYFGYRVAFLSTGLLALGAFVLTLVTVREGFVRPTRSELAARPSLGRGIISMLRSAELMPMFVVLMLTRLTIGGIGPITSLYVGELDVPGHLVPTVAGLSFSVAGVGAAITSPLLGRLGDRVGYRPILLAALAGSAVFYLPQAWVTAAWQLLVLRFILGLLNGGIQPAAHAIIGRAAPDGQQSAAYGLTFSANSLGSFTGPLLTGFLAASQGLRAVFIYTGLLVAVNAAWVAWRVREPGGAQAASGSATTQAGSGF